MKVILISKFANLGNVGDVINVKDGYGKNFLIPQKKAIFYSNTNYKIFEVKKEQFEVENQENISVAQKNKEKIDGKTITMIENASDDGKLYGSITTTVLTNNINKILGKNTISRSNIILRHTIKDIGIHNIKVNLYSDVIADVKIIVARSESEAKYILSDETASKEKAKKKLDDEVIVKKSEDKNNKDLIKTEQKKDKDSTQIDKKTQKKEKTAKKSKKD